jgi:hypothetical protein
MRRAKRALWLSALPLVAALAAGPAFAADPPRRLSDPCVQQAAYSTGANGGQLKWLAPKSPQGVVGAVATEDVSPGPAIRLTQGSAPKSPTDPLAQSKPAVKLKDVTVEKGTAEKLAPAAKMSEADIAKLLKENSEAEKSPSDKSAVPEDNEMAAIPANRDECAELVPPRPLNRNILRDVMPEPGMFPQSCPMADHVAFKPRAWEPVTFHWTASALCYKPAYFEEVRLARYGQTWGPVLQPFISAGHFFLTVPALPYAMALYPPEECVYTLGFYRAGSCTPFYLDPLPLSARAALAEGGVWTGMVFLIP